MITTRAWEGSPKEHSAKQKWLRETHSVTYVPGLSTLSDLSRIVAQPAPSFLCCLRPASSILSTCPNHLVKPFYILSGRIGKVVASHAAVARSSPAEVGLIYTMHEELRGPAHEGGGVTSQLDLPSLTPLSVAGRG